MKQYDDSAEARCDATREAVKLSKSVDRSCLTVVETERNLRMCGKLSTEIPTLFALCSTPNTRGASLIARTQGESNYSPWFQQAWQDGCTIAP